MEKATLGFRMYKICQILKHFAGTFRRAQTLKLGGVQCCFPFFRILPTMHSPKFILLHTAAVLRKLQKSTDFRRIFFSQCSERDLYSDDRD